MDYARAERLALADLLDDLGPDAPTLCAGWRTAELAAHLVVRESDPRGAAGILIRSMADRTKAAMDLLLERHSYTEVVDRFRRGPGRWAPTRVPAVDRGANTLEFFVHHEDVRRAQADWKPRELSAEVQAYLWRRLSTAGKLMFRRTAVGVLLAWPDAATVRVRKGEPTAVVEGQPGELVLYGFGRQAVARVELRGPNAATEALSQAKLGL